MSFNEKVSKALSDYDKRIGGIRSYFTNPKGVFALRELREFEKSNPYSCCACFINTEIPDNKSNDYSVFTATIESALPEPSAVDKKVDISKFIEALVMLKQKSLFNENNFGLVVRGDFSSNIKKVRTLLFWQNLIYCLK